jgi:hypothetical protein
MGVEKTLSGFNTRLMIKGFVAIPLEPYNITLKMSQAL